MAQLKLTLSVHKRWFFYPAVTAIVVLHLLGLIRDTDRAAAWLADHALTFAAR